MTEEHKLKLKEAREVSRLKKETAPVVQAENGVPTPPLEPETIQIKKTDFSDLMDRLDKQAKDIEMLYQASDKHRLAKAQSKGGTDVLIHTAKVSRWDGTAVYVLAWKLVTNRAEVINGKWVEDQTCTVIFDVGEPVTVSLLEFYRKTIQKDSGEIIGREKKYDKLNNSEFEIFHLEFPNGQKLSINSSFVN